MRVLGLGVCADGRVPHHEALRRAAVHHKVTLWGRRTRGLLGAGARMRRIMAGLLGVMSWGLAVLPPTKTSMARWQAFQHRIAARLLPWTPSTSSATTNERWRARMRLAADAVAAQGLTRWGLHSARAYYRQAQRFARAPTQSLLRAMLGWHCRWQQRTHQAFARTCGPAHRAGRPNRWGDRICKWFEATHGSHWLASPDAFCPRDEEAFVGWVAGR
jgi:hypothetical protein